MDLRKYPVGTQVRRRDGEVGTVVSFDGSASYPVRIQWNDYVETYTASGLLHIGCTSMRDVADVVSEKPKEAVIPVYKQDPRLDSRDYFTKKMGW